METVRDTGENPVLPDPPARVPRFEDLKLRQPPRPSAVPQYSAELVLAAIRECMFVVRPGDTLVVRVPPYIQQERVEAYQERVAEMLGDKPYEVLFVTGDEFAVMTARPEEAPAEEVVAETVTDPLEAMAREFWQSGRLWPVLGPKEDLPAAPEGARRATGPQERLPVLEDRPEPQEVPEKASEG